MPQHRITGIKLKDGLPRISWVNDTAPSGPETVTLKGEMECLPSLQDAWDALGDVIGRLTGIEDPVVPTGCKPSIDPDTDLLSVKLNGAIGCDYANSPTNISVPSIKQCKDDAAGTHMPDWVYEPVCTLMAEAERYINGECAQGSLPLGDGAQDGEAVGTIESEPAPLFGDGDGEDPEDGDGEPEPRTAEGEDSEAPAETDPVEHHEHEGECRVDPEDPSLENGGRAFNAGMDAGRSGEADEVPPEQFRTGAVYDLWLKGYEAGQAERADVEGPSDDDAPTEAEDTDPDDTDDDMVEVPAAAASRAPKGRGRGAHLHAVG
ncbi:hypothetical protein F1188_11145 [Roseospira marina]|uniref:Uncharacterized protein n=1 Tax=Roseospira marina TaxID=140057 RepID=A0A5M6IBW4_9PROT|nr:hypothetical protein [Roseospira marina]KAA5605447.1 hypothetical protein F1188_11145 [Roseospira marina]MBB4314555.1 hypothetical protein [Roseospira marina]MBB5088883.1 hypothetical protein [Roseospira marina]